LLVLYGVEDNRPLTAASSDRVGLVRLDVLGWRPTLGTMQ
jgi:hypothetical protein